MAGLFLLLATLWLTRDLYFAPGWGILFQKGLVLSSYVFIICLYFDMLLSLFYRYVSDTTPAILILFLLVIWPKRNIFKGHKYDHLVQWKTITTSYPWHILLLGGNILGTCHLLNQVIYQHIVAFRWWIGSCSRLSSKNP